MTLDQLAPRTAPTTVVAVVGGRWSGALAFALERSLEEPRRVRVLCDPTDAPLVAAVPLTVEVAEADFVRSLATMRPSPDTIVVEVPAAPSTHTSPALIELRNRTGCLLIEVDSEGRLLRASGPTGWSFDSHHPQRAVTGRRASGHVVGGPGDSPTTRRCSSVVSV